MMELPKVRSLEDLSWLKLPHTSAASVQERTMTTQGGQHLRTTGSRTTSPNATANDQRPEDPKSVHCERSFLFGNESCISITGFSFPKYDGIADVFRPQLFCYERRGQSSFHGSTLDLRRQAPQLDHVDIVKTWKGLSSDKAEELVFWETIFRDVLEDMLHDEVRLLDRYSERPGSPYRPGQLNHNDEEVQYFPVNLIGLVASMVRLFRRQGRPYLRWLASTGNIFTGVAQFVQTHDCFTYVRPGVEGLSVGLSLKRLESNDIPPELPLAELSWDPDYLSFDEVDYLTSEGEEFRLRPFYNSPSRAWLSSSFSGDYCVEFRTSSAWLHWNNEERCFSGIVPFFSDPEERSLHTGADIINPHPPDANGGMYALRIVLLATLTDFFPGNVRYEQTVRARITINVRPKIHHGLANLEGGQQPVNFNRDVISSTLSLKPLSDLKWPETIYRDLYLGLGGSWKFGTSSSQAVVGHGSNHVADLDFLKSSLRSSAWAAVNEAPTPPADDLQVLPLRYCAEKRRRLCQNSFAGAPQDDPNECPEPGKSQRLDEVFHGLMKPNTATPPRRQCLKGPGARNAVRMSPESVEGSTASGSSSVRRRCDSGFAEKVTTDVGGQKNHTQEHPHEKSDEVNSSFDSPCSKNTTGVSASTSLAHWQEAQYAVNVTAGIHDAVCLMHGTVTPPSHLAPIPRREREASTPTQFMSASIVTSRAHSPKLHRDSSFLIRQRDRAQFVQMLRDFHEQQYSRAQYVCTESDAEDIFLPTPDESALYGGRTPSPTDSGYGCSLDSDTAAVAIAVDDCTGNDIDNGAPLPKSDEVDDVFL
ncbi:hypothetical protein VTO42DRAFT_6794 [Malbranchea cinnamomea]